MAEPVVARSQRSHAWLGLAPLEKAAAWEAEAPQTAAKIVEMAEAHYRHLHRVEWARVTLDFFRLTCGIVSLVLLGRVAIHLADVGAPTQAAALMGGGTTLVAIFVTGRLIAHRREARKE